MKNRKPKRLRLHSRRYLYWKQNKDAIIKDAERIRAIAKRDGVNLVAIALKGAGIVHRFET